MLSEGRSRQSTGGCLVLGVAFAAFALALYAALAAITILLWKTL